MGQSRENWQRWLGRGVFTSWFAVDAVLLGFALLLSQSSFLTHNPPADNWIALILMILFAQIGFANLWLIFGPGPLAIRFPAMVGNLVAATAVFMRFIAYGGAVELPLIGFFLTMFAMYQLLGLLPLVIVQRHFGWQAQWSDEPPVIHRDQFRLRHMFIWTTAAAVLLVVLRQLLPDIAIFRDNITLEGKDYLTMALLVLMGICQPLLAGMILAANGTLNRWIELAGWNSVTALGVAVPGFFLGDLDDAMLFFAIILGQFVVLSLYVSLLRLAGLQLLTAK